MHAGGRLVLDEGPLIVAAGADVQRRCAIELAQGALAAIRETIVLGRDGEDPGALDAELRATLDGRPLLHDAIRVRGGPHARDDAHVALAPGHRVATLLSLLGQRPDATGGVLELAGPGAVCRATGGSLAQVDTAVDGLWRAWSRLCVRSHNAGRAVASFAVT